MYYAILCCEVATYLAPQQPRLALQGGDHHVEDGDQEGEHHHHVVLKLLLFPVLLLDVAVAEPDEETHAHHLQARGTCVSVIALLVIKKVSNISFTK